MLGVAQESVRLLRENTHSHFGHSCPGCWWTVFGGLQTPFSLKNKGFHSQWCWNKGSGMKSESQLRGAHLQLASRKGETHWNDSGNPGHKTQSKYKDLSDWTQEIRSHQFSLSLPWPFPSLFFDGLNWQLSSLRLLHLVREFKLHSLGFYILKASSSK